MEIKKYFWRIALTAVLGIAGCNLFNPTQSVDIKSDDAAALTYEGYLHYQKTEYSVANEYFLKAIKADSTYSEAWYGLTKTVFSTRNNLNPFELLKYLRISSQSDIFNMFREMDDAQACAISADIDTVMNVLDEFARRDMSGLTDGRIHFANFGQSYSLLNLIRAAIMSKDMNLNFNEIVTIDKEKGIIIDSAKIKNNPAVLHCLSSMALGMIADPSGGAAIVRASVPDSTDQWFTEKAYKDFTVAAANTIIYLDNHYGNSQSAATYTLERCKDYFNNGNTYMKTRFSFSKEDYEDVCNPEITIMDWRCER